MLHEQKKLIHAMDEIINLHDLESETRDTLREFTLHTVALERLLIENNIISKEDLLKEIEKQRKR